MHLCDEMLYDRIRLIKSELFKHQNLFGYSYNESVSLHDSRYSFQETSQIYGRAKYSITVKHFAYM